MTSRLMRTLVVLLACAGSMVLAPVALGDLGAPNFDGAASNRDGTPDTQAGSHPYEFLLSVVFPAHESTSGPMVPDGSAKDLQIDLPPGLIGNPTAAATCSQEALAGGSFLCPPAAQVGVVKFDYSFGNQLVPLYNVQPPPGLPDEFSFNLLQTLVGSSATVSGETGYAVRIRAENLPEPVDLLDLTITLWGVPASSGHDALRGACTFGVEATCPTDAPLKPFLRLPTSCSGPLTANLSMDYWQEPGKQESASFVFHDNASPANPVDMEGCERLPFDPSATARPDTSAADSPSGLSVDVHMPQNENPEGLAEADLKKAVVALPAGLTVNPAAANGLAACSPAQVAVGKDAAATCPDASKIGTVEVDTPLLAEPLQGGVYLASPGANPFGSLLAMYVVADGPGVVVKLPGQIEADPVTGRLTTVFDDNPQLPFSDLKVTLFGGSHAALRTPPSCGTFATRTELSPWSGTAPATVSDSFQITSGPAGGPCPAPGFAPAFTAGTVSSQAGAFSPFTMTLNRNDGEQALGGVRLQMPPGVLGVLRSVAQCPEPQASEGACAPASLVGHTTAGVGAGPSPFYLGGNVYLTGPYEGAPFGLAIVVPAIAGPFNLGTVVVRAKVEVDPHTAQITVASDPLPQILQGIPIDMRTVNVTVDRAGFIFNPTNCQALAVAGTAVSAAGASAGVSSHFQAANCASLAFHPGFSASTQARASRSTGASLHVHVGSGAGQANIGRVVVSLPKQLPSWLPTLQKACVDSVFAANPAGCPAGSVVGTATASTPVLAHSLSGPAYLVSHGGAAFPDLVVVLQGEGITLDLDGGTSIRGKVTTSSFNTVPDAPISSFDLTLPEGPHHVLAAVLPPKVKGSLCGQKLTMPTTITGQNGALIKQSTKISVTGCAKPKKSSKHKQPKHKKKG